jgi:Serine carboxypeptidase S28
VARIQVGDEIHAASGRNWVSLSRAGNLAAWFRLKYPHIADGAVASSAPVMAEEDYYRNPRHYSSLVA